MSKPNLHGTSFCVQKRQVFSLYRLINKISYIRILFKAWFMQDYSLFRVRFKQVSLYMLIPSTNQIKYLEWLQA